MEHFGAWAGNLDSRKSSCFPSGSQETENQTQVRLEGKKSVTEVYSSETIGKWTGSSNSRKFEDPYLFT